MFEHLLAGELVFLFLGKPLGFAVTPLFLIVGAFWGFAPDILSYFLNRKLNYRSKFFHLHRDNLSHSIFLPLIIFLVILLIGGWKDSLLASLAALTHPLLDLFGIGYGVKLFLPFSNKTYKLFYRGKFIYVMRDNAAVEREVCRIGEDDWFDRSYITFNDKGLSWWWGVFEWTCLIIAINLPIFYFLK
ncbi:MAG: metal-dependent hydrolase [Patescibacteria group bacterium]|nr:metal-dependent hydrolase [Patescibacteria group bacterium]